MKNFIHLFIAILFLTACGPNAQQQAAIEQAKIDSVIVATKAEAEQRTERKTTLQKQLANLETEATELKEALKNTMASLEGEKARMESVASFHLLRSSSEKAQEIKNQSLVILNIEEAIETLKASLDKNATQQNKVQSQLEQL